MFIELTMLIIANIIATSVLIIFHINPEIFSPDFAALAQKFSSNASEDSVITPSLRQQIYLLKEMKRYEEEIYHIRANSRSDRLKRVARFSLIPPVFEATENLNPSVTNGIYCCLNKDSMGTDV